MAAIMYTSQLPANLIADIPTFKSLNIDVVMAYSHAQEYDMSLPEIEDYLNALHVSGLKGLLDINKYIQFSVVANVPDVADLTVLVNTFKGHPALYGWYMCDEPKLTDANAATLQTCHDLIKSLDNNHPIVSVYYRNWYSLSTYTPYNQLDHDIFGIDEYPVVTTGQWSPSVWQANLKTALSKVGTNDPVFNILQVFGGYQAYAVPTANDLIELHNATVASGWSRSGHIAFWMWDWPSYPNATMLRDNPSLWSTVAQIAGSYSARTQLTINDLPYATLPLNGNSDYLRVFDGAATKRIPLVDVADTNATPIRVFTGSATMAIMAASGQPVVSSVSPGTVKQGSSATVAMSGYYLAGATITVDGGGVSLGTATVSDTLISIPVTVATDADIGGRAITITTSSGSASAVITVVASSAATPILTTVTPSNVYIGIATNVTITGSNMMGVTDVVYTGGQATIVSIADNRLIVTITATVTGTLAVIAAGGTSNSLEIFATEYVAPPTSALTIPIVRQSGFGNTGLRLDWLNSSMQMVGSPMYFTESGNGGSTSYYYVRDIIPPPAATFYSVVVVATGEIVSVNGIASIPISSAQIVDTVLSQSHGNGAWSAAGMMASQIEERCADMGREPTLQQALYMLLQIATEKVVNPTTKVMTVRKLDGSTEAMTFQLDSATAPKTITRIS